MIIFGLIWKHLQHWYENTSIDVNILVMIWKCLHWYENTCIDMEILAMIWKHLYWQEITYKLTHRDACIDMQAIVMSFYDLFKVTLLTLSGHFADLCKVKYITFSGVTPQTLNGWTTHLLGSQNIGYLGDEENSLYLFAWNGFITTVCWVAKQNNILHCHTSYNNTQNTYWFVTK